jgi:hypothetical protein
MQQYRDLGLDIMIVGTGVNFIPIILDVLLVQEKIFHLKHYKGLLLKKKYILYKRKIKTNYGKN